MLLDTHAVKTILLEVPSIGGQVHVSDLYVFSLLALVYLKKEQNQIPNSSSLQSAASAGYNKFVGREMGKAEALLKVSISVTIIFEPKFLRQPV